MRKQTERTWNTADTQKFNTICDLVEKIVPVERLSHSAHTEWKSIETTVMDTLQMFTDTVNPTAADMQNLTDAVNIVNDFYVKHETTLLAASRQQQREKYSQTITKEFTHCHIPPNMPIGEYVEARQLQNTIQAGVPVDSSSAESSYSRVLRANSTLSNDTRNLVNQIITDFPSVPPALEQAVRDCSDYAMLEKYSIQRTREKIDYLVTVFYETVRADSHKKLVYTSLCYKLGHYQKQLSTITTIHQLQQIVEFVDHTLEHYITHNQGGSR